MSAVVNLSAVYVRVFTGDGCQGNKAAVVIHHETLSASVMQSFAARYAMPATAFVSPQKNMTFDIRWFSPTEEIQRCGHGTLAAAYHLFEQHPEVVKLTFCSSIDRAIVVERTKSGIAHKPHMMSLALHFPIEPPQRAPVPSALSHILPAPPSELYRNDNAYFAIYPDASVIHDLKVDHQALPLLHPYALIVTAPGDEQDFVYRYFWYGINGGEDAVTGSAQTGLAPLWATKLAKNQLVARQLSKEGGVVYAQLVANHVRIGAEVEYDIV